MEVFVIKETLNHGIGFAALIGSVLLGVVIYQIIMLIMNKRYDHKLNEAISYINTGHQNALNGAKDDGIYQETRRKKTDADL